MILRNRTICLGNFEIGLQVQINLLIYRTFNIQRHILSFKDQIEKNTLSANIQNNQSFNLNT